MISNPAPPRIGVLVSGRGSNLQALLDAQAAGTLAARIVVVVSDRSDAPALARAAARGVEAVIVDPGSARARLTPEAEHAFLEVLRARDVEWVVLAGFFRIIGPVLLGAFPERILNIHPSLLPAFPGLHAQRQALAYGVRIAGCTVHLVGAEVDAGPVLAQAAVPVMEDDTEESLSARILAEEHRLLVETVNRVARRVPRLDGRRVLWGMERREGTAGPP